uniref:medium-chain acyl-CoA ligase ACSF2, mitochondrial-like isoform X2 n=1 Tax=Myxine glutinosa TaxID=7769 RepID=UPI00358F2611
MIRVLCGVSCALSRPSRTTWLSGYRGCCRYDHTTSYPAARLHEGCDVPPTQPWLAKSYVHGANGPPLLPDTIGTCIERAAQLWPEREAFIFANEGERRTFHQVFEEVKKLAQGFLALGLQPGDRIGVLGPNSLSWVLTQLAAAHAGIILVAINPIYVKDELEFALKKVGCKALVSASAYKTHDYYGMLTEICPELSGSHPGALHSKRLPELRAMVMMGESLPGTLSFSDISAAATSESEKQLHLIQKSLDMDDPINIQFTSGTTGHPKAAVLTHHNFVNNAHLFGCRMGYHGQETRICIPVPLYHSFGLVGGTLVSIIHGATLCFPSPGFDATCALSAVQKERCTIIYGVPTMYVDMLSELSIHNYDTSSLEIALMGGSPCPPSLVKRVITEMQATDVLTVYGTTENTFTFMNFPWSDMKEKKTETVGFIMPHIEAKVVDTSSGEIQPIEVSGELCIRGYCVMREYLDDPDNTATTITADNWYHTGDIAFLDAFGYCSIIGRSKDMIIRGGENVYPAEIEKILYLHPDVMEAHVVGAHDYRLGEAVCAVVKRKAGKSVSEEELQEFCKGKMARYKVPKYVVFMESFPLTVTGKIQKHHLRDDVNKILGLK